MPAATAPDDPILRVSIERLPHGADLDLPRYQTMGAAGLDLRAAVPEDQPVVLAAGGWGLVPTGLKLSIPVGYEAQVRARSGLALKLGIGVLNGPGTIDSDYRGEVGVILFNFSDAEFTIRRGDRIAQIVFAKVERVAWDEVEAVESSDRGEGGFGHTGHAAAKPA